MHHSRAGAHAVSEYLDNVGTIRVTDTRQRLLGLFVPTPGETRPGCRDNKHLEATERFMIDQVFANCKIE
jgi:hypothetical protein